MHSAGQRRRGGHWASCALAVVAASALPGCGAPADASARTNASIVNGKATASYAAVGSVHATSGAACTGSLIAADKVLTAAHCLYDAAGTRIELRAVDFEGKSYRVARTIVYPGYGADAASDLAIAVLERPVAGVAPVRINTRPLEGSLVGSPVKIVGYGRKEAGGAGFRADDGNDDNNNGGGGENAGNNAGNAENGGNDGNGGNAANNGGVDTNGNANNEGNANNSGNAGNGNADANENGNTNNGNTNNSGNANSNGNTNNSGNANNNGNGNANDNGGNNANGSNGGNDGNGSTDGENDRGDTDSEGREKRETETRLAQIDPNSFVAKDDEGHDTCQGDSGGPAFMEIDGETTLAGVTSKGIGDALCGEGGVYSRVDTHADWIREQIEN